VLDSLATEVISVSEQAKGKEVLADLMEGTKKLISRLREDVDELSTKGKFKLEIMSLKNKRARAFRDLGMRMYILTKNRKYDIPEVKSIVAEIRKLDADIQGQEEAFKSFSAGVASKGTKKRAVTSVVKRPRSTGNRKKPGGEAVLTGGASRQGSK
jgi:predicted  nucleic acid-binding Zn-ribbon protein